MSSVTDARARTAHQQFQCLSSRPEGGQHAEPTKNGSANPSHNGHYTPANGDFEPLWSSLATPAQGNGFQFGRARTGDHLAIHDLLLAIFQGPSRAEFQALLDHPTYQPGDRLLLTRHERILAHVMVSHRRQFECGQLLPSCELQHLATLPEYRGKGHTKALLEAAEEEMVSCGAAIATLRTDIPSFFEKRGWVVCGRHSYSTASPRDILATIEAAKPPKSRIELSPEEPISIRQWRHVEQDALMGIYDLHAANGSGLLQRNHEYWRWLISRQACDRIYVAIRGSEKLALGEAESRILGYAVMKGGRILELLTLPGEHAAAVRLLARACSDAIERDHLAIRLDAAPHDPLHNVLCQAGGAFHLHEAEAGEVFMSRLFDPAGYLSRLAPVLHERAKAAGLARPGELGLCVGGENYRVVLAARSVRLEQGPAKSQQLVCERGEFMQLLLGHVDVTAAASRRRLQASSPEALRTAAVLFPRLPLWRPPWDDLPAE